MVKNNEILMSCQADGASFSAWASKEPQEAWLQIQVLFHLVVIIEHSSSLNVFKDGIVIRDLSSQETGEAQMKKFVDHQGKTRRGRMVKYHL
jgi:hypothetical protein